MMKGHWKVCAGMAVAVLLLLGFAHQASAEIYAEVRGHVCEIVGPFSTHADISGGTGATPGGPGDHAVVIRPLAGVEVWVYNETFDEWCGPEWTDDTGYYCVCCGVSAHDRVAYFFYNGRMITVRPTDDGGGSCECCPATLCHKELANAAFFSPFAVDVLSEFADITD